jgi:hypothetical protein
MSSVINADGTIPLATGGAQFVNQGILSSTNASPIVLTMSNPSTAQTGDTCVVDGHLVNTAANGRWTVTRVDSTHFALNGSTGNGVGANTGYLVDYAVNPLITIPADGDSASASSVNPAFESLFNTVPFLFERVGKYRLYSQWFSSTAATANPFASGTPTTLSSTGWQHLNDFVPLITFPFSTPVADAGDILDVDIGATFAITWGTSVAQAFALRVSINGGAYGFASGGAGPCVASVDATPGNTRYPIRLRAIFPMVAAQSTFQFALDGWAAGSFGTPPVLTPIGGYLCVCNQYRLN